MTSAWLIQFGEQIANLHRRSIEDAPGRGGSPPLRRRQATVERLPDHGGDRCTALPRESADPLVALIVDENLQPMRQHAHTLACAYGAGDWVPGVGLSLTWTSVGWSPSHGARHPRPWPRWDFREAFSDPDLAGSSPANQVINPAQNWDTRRLTWWQENSRPAH